MYTARPNDRTRGNRPGQAPRARRREKIPPAPAKACRVKNSKGIFYGYDDLTRTLGDNESGRLGGKTFPSRRKAAAAVWRTIERWKDEGAEWTGNEFLLENAG